MFNNLGPSDTLDEIIRKARPSAIEIVYTDENHEPTYDMTAARGKSLAIVSELNETLILHDFDLGEPLVDHVNALIEAIETWRKSL